MNETLLIWMQLVDTVKAFLEKNKLGKYNEEEMKKRAKEKKQEEEAEEHLARSYKVGDRCEVSVQNQPTRRATILYVGWCSILLFYQVLFLSHQIPILYCHKIVQMSYFHC